MASDNTETVLIDPIKLLKKPNEKHLDLLARLRDQYSEPTHGGCYHFLKNEIYIITINNKALHIKLSTDLLKQVRTSSIRDKNKQPKPNSNPEYNLFICCQNMMALGDGGFAIFKAHPGYFIPRGNTVVAKQSTTTSERRWGYKFIYIRKNATKENILREVQMELDANLKTNNTTHMKNYLIPSSRGDGYYLTMHQYNFDLKYYLGRHFHELDPIKTLNLMAIVISNYVFNILNHNIVHCDLKPSNILYFNSATNNIKLDIADFGLAKSLGELTAGCGSLGYMAPEMSTASVNNQSTESFFEIDWYSIGIILRRIFEYYTHKVRSNRDSKAFEHSDTFRKSTFSAIRAITKEQPQQRSLTKTCHILIDTAKILNKNVHNTTLNNVVKMLESAVIIINEKNQRQNLSTYSSSSQLPKESYFDDSTEAFRLDSTSFGNLCHSTTFFYDNKQKSRVNQKGSFMSSPSNDDQESYKLR